MNYMRVYTDAGGFYVVHEKHYEELIRLSRNRALFVGFKMFESPAKGDTPIYIALEKIECFLLRTPEARDAYDDWTAEVDGPSW